MVPKRPFRNCLFRNCKYNEIPHPSQLIFNEINYCTSICYKFNKSKEFRMSAETNQLYYSGFLIPPNEQGIS